MIAFIDKRIPVGVDIGVVGGPQFSTTLNEAGDGREQANINWSLPLASWQVAD